jgi:hypothetical protein
MNFLEIIAADGTKYTILSKHIVAVKVSVYDRTYSTLEIFGTGSVVPIFSVRRLHADIDKDYEGLKQDLRILSEW